MQVRHMPSALWTGLILMLLVALAMVGCSDAGDGLAVGDRAPEFALPSASGSTVSLDDYSGSPALLYFHMADG